MTSSPLQASYTMPPFALAALATPTLARLLVALLKFEASKKAIVLDLLLEDFDGLLKVVIDDLDL